VNETRTSEPTPEQLLKLLDCQLTLARTKRATGDNSSRRTALLIGALLLIVGGCCVALLVLQQMLSDLQHRPGATGPQIEQSTAQNGNFQEGERPGTSPAKTY
jgi:hypothetical protein